LGCADRDPGGLAVRATIGSMSTLRAAAIQAESIPGDISGNATRAARLVGRAAAGGARVAVAPELFLCAYHPPTLAADPVGTYLAADAGRAVADPRLEPLRQVAREDRIVIVIGAAVRHADGRGTCSSLVIDRAGRITVGYDKQQLWGADEKALFTPGGGGATLAVDGWRFGLGICYDGCFPEHGRAAAADGADGYLVPSAYLEGSAHRRDLYYPARALDNIMYVVFANAVGGAAPLRFNGGSAIYDPEGRALGKAAEKGEAVIVADLDKAAMARSREAHSMLADRRPDLGPRRLIAT
jgi:predicted amidohydrolase